MICLLSRGLILLIGRPLSHSAVWCRLTKHTTLYSKCLCIFRTDQLFNSWELKKKNFYICNISNLLIIVFHNTYDSLFHYIIKCSFMTTTRWKLLRPWEWFGPCLCCLGLACVGEPSGSAASREENGFMTINIPWCWMSMLNMNGIPKNMIFKKNFPGKVHVQSVDCKTFWAVGL